MANLVTITRYYGSNDRDLQQLWRFIDQAKTYSKRIIVGVNPEKDLTNCLEKSIERTNENVDFIPIRPWIGISTPLNILLNLVSNDENFLLIQSIEVQCNEKHVERLRSYFVDETILCVGAALDGHQKLEKSSDRIDLFLQGDTSPWNTFIIWNVEKLRRTGFPMCADFLDPPGMEDSAVIALQQKLFAGRSQNRALLVRFSDEVQWFTDFQDDQQRLFKHQMKMKSKNIRTEQILKILNISNDEQNDLLGVEYIHDQMNSSG